jgi:hypothetical protein
MEKIAAIPDIHRISGRISAGDAPGTPSLNGSMKRKQSNIFTS